MKASLSKIVNCSSYTSRGFVFLRWFFTDSMIRIPWEVSMKKNIWGTCLSLSPTTWSRSGFVMFMSPSIGFAKNITLKGAKKKWMVIHLDGMMFIGWTYSKPIKPFVAGGYKDVVVFELVASFFFVRTIFFRHMFFVPGVSKSFFMVLDLTYNILLLLAWIGTKKRIEAPSLFFWGGGIIPNPKSWVCFLFLRWFVLKDSTTMGIHHHVLFATMWGKIIFLHFPSIEQI